jgi:hypothetical protein
MIEPAEFQITRQGNVQWRRVVGDSVVVYEASDIKQSGGIKPGVHARVKLAELHGEEITPLLRHTFNVDDAKELKWCAGQAHGRLNGTKALYPASTIENDLMMFTDRLWEVFISSARSSGWVMGDAEPSAPRWAVPGMILHGSPGIHFGDAKSGKSTIDRVLAQCLQYGLYALFPTLEQGNVVWVNAEEPPLEHSRQFGNVNAALGLGRVEPVYTVDARGLTGPDAAQRTLAAVEKTDAKHVFVDSLSRLAAGANLNENATATLLMDSLAGAPASVTWIGHTGQENRHRLTGSKQFLNAARVMVRVQGRISNRHISPELRRGLRVLMTDANGAAPIPAQYWTLEYHRDYGLKSIERSEEAEWPLLHCDVEKCRKWTWDGVSAGRIRCAQHEHEEDSDG